jgi:hypothetical protein
LALLRSSFFQDVARPRRIGIDNIKMDVKEINWYGVDSVHLVRVRDKWRALVNTVVYL